MPVSVDRRQAEVRPLFLLARSAALAGFVTLLFFLLSWNSLGRGGSERVAEAFKSDALGTEIWGDEIRGRHRFNDCLITALALEQTQPALRLAVSPVNPSEPVIDVCADLRDGTGTAVTRHYHNYLHGHTVLLRYLLPHFPIAVIKEIYKALGSILLLGGIGLCLMRLSDGERREEPVIFLVALFGLSRFFGLEWFGQSLGHGPSDIVLIGFIVFMAVRAGSLGRAEWTLAAGLFGTLTMIFEFLTGGLPLGAAAILGLGWFALADGDRSPRAVLLGLAAFGLGAAVAMAIKLLLVVLVFGGDALWQLGAAGISRAGSEVPPEFAGQSASSQLLLHFGVLTPGLPTLAAGMLGLSALLGCRAALRHRETPFLLLLGSVLPIIGWFMLFRQHTAIHGWFMARILVWPLIAGFGLSVLSALRARAGAASPAMAALQRG